MAVLCAATAAAQSILVRTLDTHPTKEAHTVTTNEQVQRVAFKLALALLVVAGSLVATVWAGMYSAPGAPAIARASANPSFYGADTTKMVNAIQHIWLHNSGAYPPSYTL